MVPHLVKPAITAAVAVQHMLAHLFAVNEPQAAMACPVTTRTSTAMTHEALRTRTASKVAGRASSRHTTKRARSMVRSMAVF